MGLTLEVNSLLLFLLIGTAPIVILEEFVSKTLVQVVFFKKTRLRRSQEPHQTPVVFIHDSFRHKNKLNDVENLSH